MWEGGREGGRGSLFIGWEVNTAVDPMVIKYSSI